MSKGRFDHCPSLDAFGQSTHALDGNLEIERYSEQKVAVKVQVLSGERSQIHFCYFMSMRYVVSNGSKRVEGHINRNRSSSRLCWRNR